jgi:signal transduction histidine kinase
LTNYKLIEEECNRKGRCVASIAHDFKVPLKAIENFCLEFQRKNHFVSNFGEDDSNSSSIDFLQKMVEYLNSLKENLNIVLRDEKKKSSLDTQIERVNTMDSEEFNLKELCQFCVQVINYLKKDNKNKDNLSIEFDFDDKLPLFLKLNQKSLKQILINLLSNAFKFTLVGQVKLTVKKIENKARFEVLDTGMGIKKEEQANLFQPFYQAPSNQSNNRDGTGLGLYIVKEFVEKLGSQLTFNSIEGHGTVFTFDLDVKNDFERSVNHETVCIETFLPIIKPSTKDLFFSHCIQ